MRSVLARLGLLTVAVLFVLIVSRLASPLVALIAVPVATALAAGFGLATAKFIVTGVQQIAPVGARSLHACASHFVYSHLVEMTIGRRADTDVRHETTEETSQAREA